MHLRLALPLLSVLTVCSCASSAGLRSSSSSTANSNASAHWTSKLVDPVSAPTTFETPLIHSSVNGMVMHQKLPRSSVFGGGDAQVYALQLRYAVNERFALIATKDGYVDFNPNLGMGQEGLADIAAGFKYALVDDRDEGILVTPGLIFETKSGDTDVFQGNGDGVLRPFVSAGWDLEEFNVLGAVGYNMPIDSDDESASVDYHVHLDYELTPQFYPLFEVNGITHTSNGEAAPFNFEGGDLINLGSTNVAGNSVITGALGARYKLGDGLLFGAAYEWPLTAREDLLDSRITVDVLFLF